MSFPERVLLNARAAGMRDVFLSEPLVAGVSGGADSLALLHVLTALRGPVASGNTVVAYLDHGFRGEAGAADGAFVAEQAAALGLRFVCARFDVPSYARALKLSAEHAARRARYAFLASVAAFHGTLVAVGHTADDQVETVLMNMLRGAGLTGLSGMAAWETLAAPADELLVAAFGQLPAAYTLFRPLLSFTRADTEAYCRTLGLTPRTDETNNDSGYLRNRIRTQLLPLLESEYSAAARRHLYTLADLARDDDSLLDGLARESAGALFEPSLDARALRAGVAELLALQRSMRRRVVRHAIAHLAGTLDDVTADHVEAVLDRASRATGAVRLPHGLEVRRMGGWIVFETAGGPPPQFAADLEKWPVAAPGLALKVKPSENLVLEAGWRFDAALAQRPANVAPGELAAHFDAGALAEAGDIEIRTRRPGDYVTPTGMRGRKALQDLMVDARIPSYLRDRLPVIALADTSRVLWVPGAGGRRSAVALVGSETKATLVLSFVRTSTT